MIAVKPHPEGAVLPVRVKPGARRSTLLGEHDGALRLSVTAAPEDGKANDAVILLLADVLRLKRGQFRLLTGASARQKSFLLEGVSPEELLGKLASALLQAAPPPDT